MLHHDVFILLPINYVETSCHNQPPTYCMSKCCPPQKCGTPCHFDYHAPKLLPVLLAAFVSSKSQAVEEASELPHACVAKRRLMQVTEQLWSASGRRYNFSVVLRDWVVGTDWLQSLHRGRNTTPLRRPWGCVILLCEMWRKWPWRLTYMNWPCHLNTAFWKRNKWKFFKILKQKMY
jgi:hypothetical protein